MKMKKTLLPWSRRLMAYIFDHSCEKGHWSWYGCHAGFQGWNEFIRGRVEESVTKYRAETWR